MAPVIIIMRFGKNYVLCRKYIDIYEFSGIWGGTYMVHHAFFIYYSKNGKSIRAWPILKSNSTFWFLKKILGWIIKKLWKGAPEGPALICLRS